MGKLTWPPGRDRLHSLAEPCVLIKYSHPEEIPLFEGATPVCKFTHTTHYTHEQTDGRGGQALSDRALLPYPTHFAHMVSTHLELQKLETSLLMYREPGGNGGS